MDTYDLIYNRLEKLIPDLTELKQGDARKSKVDGFMDLNLDVLSKSPDQMRIALSHYYVVNGDSIADPDMEIRVYLIPDWKKAEALTYQDTYRYQEIYFEDNGQKFIRPKLKDSLNQFLKQWLKNCLDQGHRLAPDTIQKDE